MTEAQVRKRMRAEDRREQILDVTHAIVTAEGFYAATPNRVAEAVGVTRAVLYQQFGDMGGLFVALVDREAERAAAQFADVIAGVDSFSRAGSITRVFGDLLRAMDEAPDTWRLFLLPPEGAPQALSERLALSEANVRLFLQEALAASYPELRDPEYFACVAHAIGRELFRLRLTDPAHATHERITAVLTDLVSGART